jgi:glycosyltransferase involved in cell wall biosynthesis
MTPKLSIITPTLNQGAFIERTILSVLDQGYPDLEYVIVDGGSTDGTLEVIRRYENRLAWWVSEPDDGQTDALNKALARTTGQIVAYINSDDYYLPGALQAAVDSLGDAEWVAGAARFVDAEDRVTEVWRPQAPQDCELLPRGRHWWMLRPWGVPQSSTFWRRSVFERVGEFRADMHYAFDTEFFLRTAYAGMLPALTDRELSVRVVHDAAKSADFAPFQGDIDRYVEIFRDRLDPAEQRRLRASLALRRFGAYRPYFLAKLIAEKLRRPQRITTR